jgi:hypothetical protein
MRVAGADRAHTGSYKLTPKSYPTHAGQVEGGPAHTELRRPAARLRWLSALNPDRLSTEPGCPLRPAHADVGITKEAAEVARPIADVAPIHDRQMVGLERSDRSAWLEQTGNEADLLRALPAGSLKVEQVR